MVETGQPRPAASPRGGDGGDRRNTFGRCAGLDVVDLHHDDHDRADNHDLFVDDHHLDDGRADVLHVNIIDQYVVDDFEHDIVDFDILNIDLDHVVDNDLDHQFHNDHGAGHDVDDRHRCIDLGRR